MNRKPFRFVVLVAFGLLLAACAPSASQPSESSGGEPSTGESQPAASQPGGGGGGGGANGSVQYEITGDYTDSGELAFVPEGSFFDQSGSTYLSFANEDESTILLITLSDSGDAVNFGNQEVAIAAGDCTFNLTQNDANGASGTFDCPNSLVIPASGAPQGTATIRGSFEARP